MQLLHLTLPEQNRVPVFERMKAGAVIVDLLADPGIEIVVNLTIPKAHAEVDIAAFEAGIEALRMARGG